MNHQLFLFTTLTLLASTQVMAQSNSDAIKDRLEKQPTCESFVRFDADNLYLGAERNSVRVVSLNQNTETTLATEARVIDAVRNQQTLWILTSQSLEEWDLGNSERVSLHATSLNSGPMQNWENPTGLALYKNDLVISHGIRGASIFDLSQKKVVQQLDLNAFQAPYVSTASGVAVTENKAYFVMDDVTMVQPGKKPAFRGVIVYDLETERIEHRLDKMDAGADAVSTDGKKLIVSFMGLPVWKYGLSTLKGSSVPTPEHRIWKFGREGHPIGRASVDEKYYYTCFQAREGRSQYKRVPVALDRQTLKLD